MLQPPPGAVEPTPDRNRSLRRRQAGTAAARHRVSRARQDAALSWDSPQMLPAERCGMAPHNAQATLGSISAAHHSTWCRTRCELRLVLQATQICARDAVASVRTCRSPAQTAWLH